MKWFRNFLFFLILGVMVLPFLQSRYHILKDPDLMGYIKKVGPPDLNKFSKSSWLSSSFQEGFRESIESHVGFKSTLTRLSNQYDYSLFGMSNAGIFLAGYDHVLFDDAYIFEYTGEYFIGKIPIDRKVSLLKDIIPLLKSMGVDLVPVLLPGKARFFPEMIPAHFHPERRTLSNYEYFCNRFDRCNIPYLDLNHYFLCAKDTSRYPLFPKFGMHWGTYGMIRAMDTLLRYIETLHQTKLPHIMVEKVTITDTVPGDDNDIGILLNLMFPLRYTPTAFPQYTIVSGPGQKKLKVLIISDSYYDLVQKTIAADIFSENEYWYYNEQVKTGPNEASDQKKIDKSDLLNKLKQFDVILLMTSEVNLHSGFFGFIEETYSALHPGVHENPVLRYENLVRNNREWFTSMVKKASSSGHTLEQTTTLDARYQFSVEYPQLKNKTSTDSIEYIACRIRSDPGASAIIRQKAEKNKIPFEQMIYIDANSQYSQSKKKNIIK
jgi:SGNH hydrolase-like domain, acetyltransferase AlgX